MTDLAGTTVTFWFDPLCPATWATSQWLRDVAPQRRAGIDWQVMSLAILNEDQELSGQQRDRVARSWRAIRVLAAAGNGHGPSAIGRLYRALGVERHDRRRPVDDDLLTDSLSAAGLPIEMVGAADDPAWDDVIRASHHEGQRRVGMDSGSPIIAFGTGTAFFGPVVAPVPTGDSALDLWAALTAASRVPELSEIKRGRGSL